MIPVSTLYDEYIDRPMFIEQKHTFEYIVPSPSRGVGTKIFGGLYKYFAERKFIIFIASRIISFFNSLLRLLEFSTNKSFHKSLHNAGLICFILEMKFHRYLMKLHLRNKTDQAGIMLLS